MLDLRMTRGHHLVLVTRQPRAARDGMQFGAYYSWAVVAILTVTSLWYGAVSFAVAFAIFAAIYIAVKVVVSVYEALMS